MSIEPSTASPTPRSQILEDAWHRFAKYDKNAVIAQKRFVQQRKWILSLGVVATTLAILYSVLERNVQTGAIVFPAAISPWFNPQQFLDAFRIFVIAVPIIVTVLVAFSEKFNMGISWVMLRSSAEAIKKEIYRYRMQVDEYSSANLTSAETRDVRLARKMKVVSKRLMETPVNQTDLLPYKGELPPPFSMPPGDDGFSNMTAELYLNWRVEDQFNYYQKKAAQLGKTLRRFQLLIIFLGGVGAFLAAIRLEIWLAVSNAFAVAFTSYLEFKRIEANVIACNLSASDLYDIRIWWHALSSDAKAERANVETLVSSTEAVLQAENAGWLQEMREALAEIYKEKQAPQSAKISDDLTTSAQLQSSSAPESQPSFVHETVSAEVETPDSTVQPTPASNWVSSDAEASETDEPAAAVSDTADMPEPGVFMEPSPDVAASSSDHSIEAEPAV